MDPVVSLAALLDVDPRVLPVGGLVAARLAPLFWLAPFLGGRAVPASIRAVVLIAVAASLTPLALAAAPEAPGGPLPPALVSELLRGLVYAFAVALPFHALEWAGREADLWRGAQAGEGLVPDSGEAASPLAIFYRTAAVAAFVLLGGHVKAFDALVGGFARVPLGTPVDPGDLAAVADGAARLTADALALSLAVAAPAAVAIVLTEVLLGLLARAAPQIPMFFAGLPLRAAVALAALALAASLTWPRVIDAFRVP